MTGSYIHAEMPPVIRRTAHDHYQLEGQSGVVISEFDGSEIEHPASWWSDLVTDMRTHYSDPADAIHDLTLLSVQRDWIEVDETVTQS